MLGWKSRWSWERLRKAATAKRVPSTRPSRRAWLETSAATARAPSDRMTASSAWKSGASGVVSRLASGRPATRLPVVPISPATWPQPSSAASTRYEVVVLPEVPVIPTTSRSADGSPATTADTAPRIERGSGWTSTGTRSAADPINSRPAASVSTADAPASSAAEANEAPWTRVPGSAAKSVPGPASWARMVAAVTSTSDPSPWPRTEARTVAASCAAVVMTCPRPASPCP